MIKYTIPGIPRTKKNSQRIVTLKTKNGKSRSIIMPSKAYVEYEKEAKQYLEKPVSVIDYPISIKCIYFMPLNKDGTIPKLRPDLCNLIEATCDILVKHNIIADDNCEIIKSHDGSRVYFTNTEPRAEIVIEGYKEGLNE